MDGSSHRLVANLALACLNGEERGILYPRWRGIESGATLSDDFRIMWEPAEAGDVARGAGVAGGPRLPSPDTLNTLRFIDGDGDRGRDRTSAPVEDPKQARIVWPLSHVAFVASQKLIGDKRLQRPPCYHSQVSVRWR